MYSKKYIYSLDTSISYFFMKKHTSLFITSTLLMVSLSACSITRNETPSTPESIPVIVEDTPSQNIIQKAPEGFVPEKDLKQEALEKDTNIIT